MPLKDTLKKVETVTLMYKNFFNRMLVLIVFLGTYYFIESFATIMIISFIL